MRCARSVRSWVPRDALALAAGCLVLGLGAHLGPFELFLSHSLNPLLYIPHRHVLRHQINFYRLFYSQRMLRELI